MSRSYSVTIERRHDRDRHASMVAATEALQRIGVELLPTELADYFGVVRVDDALDGRQYDVHTLAHFTFNHTNPKGLPAGMSYAELDGEERLTIDIGTVPSDARFIHVSIRY